MATSLHKMQYAPNACEGHPELELTIFCKSCKKRICSLCFKQHHLTHEWDLISELAKNIRKDLPGICRKIKDDDISELKKQVELFQTLIATMESNSQKAENLDKVRRSLIKDFNELVDGKVDDNQKSTASTIRGYKEKFEYLGKKLQYLEMMSNALGTEGDTFSDHDIIEMEQEMRTELDNAKSYNAEKYSHCNVFVPGELNYETVAGMTGEIHNITLEETSVFRKFSSPILTIVPESEDTAWIGNNESKTVDLVTKSGEKLKRLSKECLSLTILQNRYMALTNVNDRELKIMNEKEELIKKLSTKPLHPTRISKTEEEEILVTLIDDGDRYSLLPTSRRIVRRMTLKGEVLHTYEFEEDGETRLFTLPTNTAENKNTDVCIINATSGISSHLVVLHRDGRIKFTYRGRDVSPENFAPFDVECDSKCRIIISDLHSESLQILSPCGQFLSAIRFDNNSPYAITLKGQILWVGFKDGAVKVYKCFSM